MAKKNEIGNIYSNMTVLHEADINSSGQVRWICKCSCGVIKTVDGSSLRSGRVKSCGCKSPKFTTERTKKHGYSRSRTYVIWTGMKNRCSSFAKGKTAKNYYEKGIRVCERWLNFENFLEDMGEAPIGYSIGRINGNLNYCLENCRWETDKQQANNTTRSRIVEFNGKKMTISQWADHIGIKPNTLLYRLKRGWSINRAINQ